MASYSYVCIGLNKAGSISANVTLTVLRRLEVTAAAYSGQEMAGIVLGALFLLILVSLVIFLMILKSKKLLRFRLMGSNSTSTTTTVIANSNSTSTSSTVTKPSQKTTESLLNGQIPNGHINHLGGGDNATMMVANGLGTLAAPNAMTLSSKQSSDNSSNRLIVTFSDQNDEAGFDRYQQRSLSNTEERGSNPTDSMILNDSRQIGINNQAQETRTNIYNNQLAELKDYNTSHLDQFGDSIVTNDAIYRSRMMSSKTMTVLPVSFTSSLSRLSKKSIGPSSFRYQDDQLNAYENALNQSYRRADLYEIYRDPQQSAIINFKSSTIGSKLERNHLDQFVPSIHRVQQNFDCANRLNDQWIANNNNSMLSLLSSSPSSRSIYASGVRDFGTIPFSSSVNYLTESPLYNSNSSSNTTASSSAIMNRRSHYNPSSYNNLNHLYSPAIRSSIGLHSTNLHFDQNHYNVKSQSSTSSMIGAKQNILSQNQDSHYDHNRFHLATIVEQKEPNQFLTKHSIRSDSYASSSSSPFSTMTTNTFSSSITTTFSTTSSSLSTSNDLDQTAARFFGQQSMVNHLHFTMNGNHLKQASTLNRLRNGVDANGIGVVARDSPDEGLGEEAD